MVVIAKLQKYHQPNESCLHCKHLLKGHRGYRELAFCDLNEIWLTLELCVEITCSGRVEAK